MGIFTNQNGEINLLRIVLAIVVVVLTVGLLVGGVRIVPSGYKGVITTFGEITGEAGEGIHFINPLTQDIINMDTQIHNVTLSNLSCATIDEQEVTAKVTVMYQIDEAYVQDIYRNQRTDFESRAIVNNLEASIKTATSKFKPIELINREALNLKFKTILNDVLTPYHIKVLDTQIGDLTFSDEYYNQIEKTNTARQKIAEEQNNLEIIRLQQEQEVVKKEAEAQMLNIYADAYANATITRALADAEALQIIADQLGNATDAYLVYLEIQKWDGQVPEYYASEGKLPFVLVPRSTETNSTIP